MQEASPLLMLSPSSPSFNSYSSGTLAAIAARVVQEIANESSSQLEEFQANNDIFSWNDTERLCVENHEEQGKKDESNNREQNHEEVADEDSEEQEADEFEFAILCREPGSSPISADEIFFNGQIRPVYPVFNRDLLLARESDDTDKSSKPPATKPTRLSLRKLFREETREGTSTSCSSSEADELESLAHGAYCVWTPKKASKESSSSSSDGKCKKSNSTGSSKRWNLRDLLYRSNSDGKDTFVFLAPRSRKSSGSAGAGGESKEKTKEVKKGGVFNGGSEDQHYNCVKNMAAAVKEGDKRRSTFFPYRHDLVGIFSNVNGLSRNLHPF